MSLEIRAVIERGHPGLNLSFNLKKKKWTKGFCFWGRNSKRKMLRRNEGRRNCSSLRVHRQWSFLWEDPHPFCQLIKHQVQWMRKGFPGRRTIPVVRIHGEEKAPVQCFTHEGFLHWLQERSISLPLSWVTVPGNHPVISKLGSPEYLWDLELLGVRSFGYQVGCLPAFTQRLVPLLLRGGEQHSHHDRNRDLASKFYNGTIVSLHSFSFHIN